MFLSDLFGGLCDEAQGLRYDENVTRSQEQTRREELLVALQDQRKEKNEAIAAIGADMGDER